MKTQNDNSRKFNITGLAGLILILPTTYYLTAAFLKYGLGIDFIIDPVDNFFSNFIIDIGVIFFPVIALAVNLIPLLDIDLKVEAGKLVSMFAIKLKPLNIIISVICIGYLMIIFAYGIRENLMIREHSKQVYEVIQRLVV